MFKFREDIISNCQKSFLIKNLNDYTRLDGRAFDEFRQLSVEFGKDWGCCYVSLGQTRVVAQVSCEIQQPNTNRPSEGILNINVELTPLAAPSFEAGRTSELSIQLNSTLEKCIKNSKAVDLESLCIKVNEKVWMLRVDVNVLNHDGNILDCASVAALSALAHFRRPDITMDGEVTILHKYSERNPIPTVIHHYPVCTSYAVFNESNVIVADPGLLEESVADANLMIALNSYKEICGLHLGGSASIDTNVILDYASKAASRSVTVVEKIKESIEIDNQKRFGYKSQSISDCKQFEKDLKSFSQSLEVYVDKWVTTKEKRRWKKKSIEENMEVDNLQANIVKPLEKGTATLVSVEGEDPWGSMSDEENAEVVMACTANEAQEEQNRKPISNHNTDSEEENVIVLNASLLGKKRKHRTK